MKVRFSGRFRLVWIAASNGKRTEQDKENVTLYTCRF